MEERNEEEEKRIISSKSESVNGDVVEKTNSDDGMEVDNFEDEKSSEKENDSELVDSDVNVEGTELTSSDVDMSDEPDSKNDVSSDAESNPYSLNETEVPSPAKESNQSNSDEEETFALEIKDGKEDSGDEEFANTNQAVEDEKETTRKSDDVDSSSDPNESTPRKETGASKGNHTIQSIKNPSKETNLDECSQSPKQVDVDTEFSKIDTDSTKLAERNTEEKTTNEEMDIKEIENISPSKKLEDEVTEPANDEIIESQETAAIVQKEGEISMAESKCEENPNSGFDSDFIGFDATLINSSLQIYQRLQENHEELIKSFRNATFTSLEEPSESIDLNSAEPLPQTTSATPELVSPVKLSSPAEDIPVENRNSDEQMANSKRIKKKRKFFDEFEDSEGEPAKKLHLMKDRENTSIENNLSENKENVMSSEKHTIKDDTLCDTSATSSAFVSSTPNPPKVESKGRFDITNPDFKEPFKYGWRREVVYRYISDDGKKRSADVSYFNPQGKKLRSIKQITDHLPSDGSLHVKNFTFSKELIFGNRESELEVIRFTKKMEMELLTNESDLSENLVDGKLGVEAVSSIIDRKLGIEPGEDHSKTEASKKLPPKKKETQNKSKFNIKSQSLQGFESTTPIVKSKLSKKAKNIEGDTEETSNATPKLAMPKILLRGPSVNSNSAQKSSSTKPTAMKVKIAPSKTNNQKTVKKSSKPKSDKSSKLQRDKRDKNSTGDAETDALNAEWSTSHLKSISGEKSALSSSLSSKRNEGRPACSISCPSALGTIPTLQCTVCLNLFHFQCCGLDADRNICGYVCKNCRMCERKKENGQSIYKTVQRTSHSPKRLYPVDHYRVVPVNETHLPVVAKNTKIVDGVTTWLPSSSNIHLSAKSGAKTNASSFSASSTVDAEAPPVQSVLELDGRRYVIVPKQSVLSISPNATMFFENHASTCEKSSVSRCVNGDIPDTLLVDPKDVNSPGVVLVPVLPPNTSAVCPQIFPSSRYHSMISKCPVENATSTYGMNTCDGFTDRSSNETNEIQSLDFQSSFTLSNISRIYDPLLVSLKYLTVRDLLRVSMTSKFLNRIASDPYLWKTVRLRNSQVHDWNGFAKTLQKFGTKRLDMRKMLGSNVPEDLVKMWNNFLEVIPTITSLEHIDFSRVPTSVVDSVAASCSNLSVINALYLKNGSLQLENFAKLKNLTKLRLKGVSGIQLERHEQKLQFINKDNLREISLTSIRNLDMDLLKIISEATNLVTLELGECAKLPAEFASETLSRLTKLEKLRLEKLQDLAPNYDFLNVIKDMNTLKYLELINIEVKDGFDDALASCKNLEHLLIIPTYVSQSATTNQLIINGIEKLSDTIKCFVWGLTTELLKVTDLFMDQWQGQKGNNSAPVKKAIGDSIPIRKSVDKLASDGDTVPTHVDILPVPKLEKMLTTLLPNTRVKVIKVPFQMTWRQSLSECLK